MMTTTERSRQIFNVIVLCLLWYIISSSNNVIGKMVLSEFPYPMTVTMVQLSSITLYSGPFFNFWGVRKNADLSWPYYFRLIVPLALGKFLASVTSHISIWKVPVSYAHTGKLSLLFASVHFEYNLCVRRLSIYIYVYIIWSASSENTVYTHAHTKPCASTDTHTRTCSSNHRDVVQAIFVERKSNQTQIEQDIYVESRMDISNHASHMQSRTWSSACKQIRTPALPQPCSGKHSHNNNNDNNNNNK